MPQQLPPFKKMAENQLKKLQLKFEPVEFQNGDNLFTEGDDALHLWVVREGCVDLRFELPDNRPVSGKMTVDSVEVEEREPAAKVLEWSCFVPPYKMRLSACINFKTMLRKTLAKI